LTFSHFQLSQPSKQALSPIVFVFEGVSYYSFVVAVVDHSCPFDFLLFFSLRESDQKLGLHLVLSSQLNHIV
jgi:hypothetical protein